MDLKTLSFDFTGSPIRLVKTYDPDGPWFVVQDVCRALGLTPSGKTLRNIHSDDKGRYQISTLGGVQSMSVVNESGLYDLVFRSAKKNARAFQRWVTGEVLPSIRKTGSYARPDAVGVERSLVEAVTAGLTEVSTALMRLPFSAPLLPPYAQPEEIEQIRELARQLSTAKRVPLLALWKDYRERHHLGASRRAFGTIPRRCVQTIMDELLAELEAAEKAPVSALRLAAAPKTHRAADPKRDFNPQQVSAMLRDIGPLIAPVHLAGALGFYDLLQLNPLWRRSARNASDRGPYLDQARFDLLHEFMTNHPQAAWWFLKLLEAVPMGVREAILDGRKPRGWDVFRRVGAND